MFMVSTYTNSHVATFSGTDYENIKLKHRNSELLLMPLPPEEFK